MAMIVASDLGKRYQLGQNTPGYGRLTDSISNAFRRRRGEEEHTSQDVWALRHASFEVRAGEVVGLIGRNGAGKSTLLKLLARVTTPTEGRAEIDGRVGSLLEVGTGFHQELTGRENVYLSGAILGMRRAEIQRKFDEIVEFAELERFIDTPVKRYSSGMGLRLGFAVAAFLEPEVLLVDEVLAVGDLEFRKKCLGRIGEVSQDDGRTVVFVSHDLNSILSTCPRAVLVERGRLVEDGPSQEVVSRYESLYASSVAASGVFTREAPGGLLTSVRIEGGDASGHLSHGDAIRLVVETDPASSARRFSVDILILDRRQRPVAYLSSGVMQDRFFSAGDVAECEIPFLPFVPGVYSVDVAARVPGVQALDEWFGEIAFEVGRFDPFGVGSTFVASEASGPFVPQHEWRAAS